MRTRVIITASLAALFTLTSSCMKEERELTYANQETKISQFVEKQQSSNPDARVVYNEGSTRVVTGEGSGPELTARGTVGIYFAGYDFTSGSTDKKYLFATNNYSFATSSGWELSDSSAYDLLKIDMTDKDTIAGLRSGLEGVREGEECYILFSGRYGFGKSKIGTISANAPLAFHVWVQTVEN